MKHTSPIVIAISQQKGGTGKTTTALCIGAELAQQGCHCLLVDLSPSGNLTSALGFSLNQLTHTTSDLFQNGVPTEKLIKTTSITGLNIVPANRTLSAVPQKLYQQQGYDRVLYEVFSRTDFLNYDFIILDCPPGSNPLTENAMTAADLMIIPLDCEFFTLQSLENMFQLIEHAREHDNPQLSYRLLLTKIDYQDSHHKQTCEQIKRHYKAALLETTITLDHTIPQSQLAGIPLSIYCPESKSSQQYRTLTKEILLLLNHGEPLSKEIEVT